MVMLPVTPDCVQLSVVVPTPTAVTCPCEPEALDTVAMAADAVDQVQVVVTSTVVPSVKVAVAVAKVFVPCAIDKGLGAMAIDLMVAAVTVTMHLSSKPSSF